ncbi:uncharacterized protein PGTG_06867 [Puccinia graminis f. sp. tritici CRL 75-36-700-3]|uniref:Uncharacterized protein n=1 Tax=Puccinia graminis f. sp. tritici (strain CRL 75-36-700-3 / race SCCL) TaxID=418459 RepID=E3KA84_PUCGT|nr:uncharacterized protein PGTG_06867 [Puccinia graminis f. sp. tritici CRL 75-36-700-3]EFP81246.1 hypothetical protein PGTG_06867 [Puccinia graminis f. sp. tritici CRL 75-36-700-3]
MGALFDAALNGSDDTQQAETTIKQPNKGKQPQRSEQYHPVPSTSHHSHHLPSNHHKSNVNVFSRPQYDRHPAPHQAPSAAEKEMQEFQAAKLRLEQAKLISQTVSHINNCWKTENTLRADGTNFSQWTRELREIGTSHLSDPEFFFTDCNNSTFEKIGRLVIFAGVHQDLVPDIQPQSSTPSRRPG